MTAGNQTREMLLLEPWLTDVEPTMMPRPRVKWAYEPVRAEDIPAVFMRAVATALQPPAGPVFLSFPLDDWDKPYQSPAVVRSVSRRVAADPSRLAEFAKILTEAKSPVLIYGAAIVRGNGWDQAAAFAEALGAPVWAAPASERAPFPENHPVYAGFLPFAMKPLSAKLQGHDVALVVVRPCFGIIRTFLVRICQTGSGCCISPTTPPKPREPRSATVCWAMWSCVSKTSKRCSAITAPN